MSFHKAAHKDTEHPAGKVLVGDIGHTEVDVATLVASVYEPDRAAFAKYYGLNVNPLSYDFDFVGYGRNIHLNPLTGNALSWCELYLPDDSAKQGRAYLVDNGNWATVQDEIDAYGLTIKPGV
jgi:hypothetical protein